MRWAREASSATSLPDPEQPRRAGARRGAALPPRAPRGRARRRRPVAGRRPLRGPARDGRDRSAQGRVPRRARPRPPRPPSPGREIRAARAPEEPRLQRGRDPVPRPRHRRQHDDLHLRQRRAPPAVAVSRLRPAGRPARAAARAPTARSASIPQNFLEWRARARSFEALALLQTPPLNVMGSNGAEQISRVQTTSELFRVFGVASRPGARVHAEEKRPGDHAVVILGHGFWQRWFGGDPSVLGRRLAVPMARSRSSASRRRTSDRPVRAGCLHAAADRSREPPAPSGHARSSATAG